MSRPDPTRGPTGKGPRVEVGPRTKSEGYLTHDGKKGPSDSVGRHGNWGRVPQGSSTRTTGPGTRRRSNSSSVESGPSSPVGGVVDTVWNRYKNLIEDGQVDRPSPDLPTSRPLFLRSARKGVRNCSTTFRVDSTGPKDVTRNDHSSAVPRHTCLPGCTRVLNGLIHQ